MHCQSNDNCTIISQIRAMVVAMSCGATPVMKAHCCLDTPAIRRVAVEALVSLFQNGAVPKLVDVLQCVSRHKLFTIPESLDRFALTKEQTDKVTESANDDSPEDVEDKGADALRAFLDAPFDQVKSYASYVKGEAPFDTHQGVKGLEFDRVLVIMDDEEARGFLFSYGKLFGATEKTKTDIENERAGNETGIDRTRRLFYVTCSRAKQGLAIVAYSSDPRKVRASVIERGWLNADEIEEVM